MRDRSFGTLKIVVACVMLIGLPLLGIQLAGLPLERYFEFPPQSRYVAHAPFSWLMFVGYAGFVLAVAVPLALRAIRCRINPAKALRPAGNFPWWGKLGVMAGLISWVLAWSRFDWAHGIQPHTFTPLWFYYILVINALSYRRTGHCMLLDSPGYFLALFPASALFWWFFEYLNRFVQNWFYQGPPFGAVQYVIFATLPFSTVLPAVLGTRQWLWSCGWLQNGFRHFVVLPFPRSRLAGWAVLILSAAGLAGIGVWPNRLFALLWVSPMLIVLSLQVLAGQRHVLSALAEGDWRLVVASATAALICGFFWEMWNFYSLSRWTYSIPYVGRFRVFEMPVLGYAGYLPFGLECSLIGSLLAPGPADLEYRYA
jgi:hypothetical protein